MDKQKLMEEFDLDELVAIEGKSRGGGSGGYPSVSITYAGSRGKRIALTNSLMEKLGNPTEVQFGLKSDQKESSLVIGSNLFDNNKKYAVKNTGGTNIIYSGPVVKEIVERFGLDYSNGRTSKSFNDIQF